MGWLASLRRWFAGSPAAETVNTAIGGHHVTRPADWTDVEHLAALLERHRVEYVLIGGYALYANGLIRNTGDIDIVVRDTPKNNAAWIAALSELPDGAAKELHDETAPFPKDAETDDQPGTIRVLDVFVIDVMPRACGLSYEDLEPFIARLEQAGQGINVLDLDGLLRTKQSAREKDVADRHQIELALARRRDQQ
jgi:hypothetical protein